MDFSALTHYLDSLEGTYSIPALDCAVYYQNKEIYRHMAGYSNQEKTRPVSSQDIYFIYSAIKVITSVAVMQLVERGLISLDDTLAKYIPEFDRVQVLEKMPDMTVFPFETTGPSRPSRKPIKIVDLLSMTSGVSYDLESDAIQKTLRETDHQADLQQLARAMANQPLLCEPGEHWVYGLSHDVLGAVVEIVTGMTFAQYLRANIFDLLDMQDVFFDVTTIPLERISEQYAGNMQNNELHRVAKKNRYALTPRYQSGGAGIACTLDAYGKFVRALCNGGVSPKGDRILTAASIAQMQTNRLHAEALKDYRRGGKAGYGYGLGVRTLMDASESPSAVGEFGWDGAAGAYVLIDLANQLGIVYMQHTLMFPKVYFEIHPEVRNQCYAALGKH